MHMQFDLDTESLLFGIIIGMILMIVLAAIVAAIAGTGFTDAQLLQLQDVCKEVKNG